jgi:hypothetical protein
MAKLKSISRVDRPAKHTFGWYVRVQFGHQARKKFFSDRLHGGRQAALERAIRFRDRAERELGRPRTVEFVVGANRLNKTGCIGVRKDG